MNDKERKKYGLFLFCVVMGETKKVNGYVLESTTAVGSKKKNAHIITKRNTELNKEKKNPKNATNLL